MGWGLISGSRYTKSSTNAGKWTPQRLTEISIKQIYGWTVYACLFLLLLFLLYDAPLRRELKRMPPWHALRKEIARSFGAGKK